MQPCCLSTALQHAALLCTQQCSYPAEPCEDSTAPPSCHVVVPQPEPCVVTANEVRSIKAVKSHLWGLCWVGFLPKSPMPSASQVSYLQGAVVRQPCLRGQKHGDGQQEMPCWGCQTTRGQPPPKDILQNTVFKLLSKIRHN